MTINMTIKYVGFKIDNMIQDVQVDVKHYCTKSSATVAEIEKLSKYAYPTLTFPLI